MNSWEEYFKAAADIRHSEDKVDHWAKAEGGLQLASEMFADAIALNTPELNVLGDRVLRTASVHAQLAHIQALYDLGKP